MNTKITVIYKGYNTILIQINFNSIEIICFVIFSSGGKCF